MSGNPTQNNCVTLSDDPRNLLIEMLTLADGNILKTSCLMGVARWSVQRWVKKYKLWPVVTQIREDARNRRMLRKKLEHRRDREYN